MFTNWLKAVKEAVNHAVSSNLNFLRLVLLTIVIFSNQSRHLYVKLLSQTHIRLRHTQSKDRFKSERIRRIRTILSCESDASFHYAKRNVNTLECCSKFLDPLHIFHSINYGSSGRLAYWFLTPARDPLSLDQFVNLDTIWPRMGTFPLFPFL